MPLKQDWDSIRRDAYDIKTKMDKLISFANMYSPPENGKDKNSEEQDDYAEDMKETDKLRDSNVSDVNKAKKAMVIIALKKKIGKK